MKTVFSTNNLSNTTDIGLLIARVAIAALMFTHGIPKLMMLLSGAPIQFPAVMGMSAALSLGLTIFAEVLCSVFILIGLATRLAVIPLIITMLIAVLFIHQADPFAVKESALHYLLVYVVLLFTGSGKYSIDNLFQTKS
jgi:putative oxidoreductase